MNHQNKRQEIIEYGLISLLTAIFIIVFLILFHIFNLDIIIQNNFFNFVTEKWFVDKDELVKKIIFYKIPKIFISLNILTFFALSIYSFKKKSYKFHKYRHQILLIFLGLSLIPLIAGNVKKFTNTYCPSQLEIYGGDKPYIKIFDSYPVNFVQEKKGKCFPAGHVTSVFAFYILFFALKSYRQKIISFLLATLFGWIIGLYQILKGAHFVSDTLITMLVCFLLACYITMFYRIVQLRKKKLYDK